MRPTDDLGALLGVLLPVLVTEDGALMEPSGRNRGQPVANGAAAKSRSNRRKPLLWVATGCRVKSMVRRGRPFESVRGLCRSAAQRRFAFRPTCCLSNPAGVYGAFTTRRLAGQRVVGDAPRAHRVVLRLAGLPRGRFVSAARPSEDTPGLLPCFGLQSSIMTLIDSRSFIAR
jgi:hypothetical protein